MPPRQDTLLGLVLGVRPLILHKWTLTSRLQGHLLCEAKSPLFKVLIN